MMLPHVIARPHSSCTLSNFIPEIHSGSIKSTVSRYYLCSTRETSLSTPKVRVIWAKLHTQRSGEDGGQDRHKCRRTSIDDPDVGKETVLGALRPHNERIKPQESIETAGRIEPAPVGKALGRNEMP